MGRMSPAKTDPGRFFEDFRVGEVIEHAGFPKGWHLPRYASGEAPASLSTKHTLALTNRGTATTADVVELAREIRAGVREKYGVTLVPEPTLIGCSLDDPRA